jgi:fructose-bisphosphate aldolase class 1
LKLRRKKGMINLKVEEAEVPISEETLNELIESLKEMKRRGIKKSKIGSPYTKTRFILSVAGEDKPLKYGLKYYDYSEHG